MIKWILLWEGLTKAIELIISGDAGIFEITLLTLRVSFTAILISTIIGNPIWNSIRINTISRKKTHPYSY